MLKCLLRGMNYRRPKGSWQNGGRLMQQGEVLLAWAQVDMVAAGKSGWF